MAGRDFLEPRWFRVPLAVGGLLVLLGTVIAAIVALSIAFYVLLGALFGVPPTVVIADRSISRIAAERATEPLAWIAGLLLCIVSIPYFDRYNRWLGRVLRETDVDIDGER
ncbi:hypothetical protein [Natronorubrum sp. FCH18a]|uniref:hypothetical protein n=1 Tax=Natronorubrum sp. FCH18a TaxID=3447018 RepID=UPI003F5156D3